MKLRYVLLVILLVVSFLRLWRLSSVPTSLFGDELDVGYQAYSILKTGKDYSGNPWPMHFRSLAEWRTPLYLYSAVPTVAIWGISPLGVRVPAAVFGILSIWVFYLLTKEITKDAKIGLISATVLTLSPWHIQYSRAAFEVTELLFFLLLGLWLFLKSLKTGRYLWLSALSFSLTPWIYSTAKLYIPVLLVFLITIYFRELKKISRTNLVSAIVVLLVIGGSIAWSTLWGGGSQRFGDISVFNNVITEPEIGALRQHDSKFREKTGTDTPVYFDRLFHNKYVSWTDSILDNYFQAFSTDFLFNEGDPNLRHSIQGMGQFYRIESLPLFAGLVLFFGFFKDKRKKFLVAFLLLFAAVPSAMTRGGGMHATRLILLLPPMAFLIAYGLYEGIRLFKKNLSIFLAIVYGGIFLVSFVFYEHNYWIHNPWNSERWWHSGFEEAIKTVKVIEGNYDRVVISTANEPPWVFFAAWYEYPPDKWQKEFPLDNVEQTPEFGRVSHIDKFYFGNLYGEDVYSWGKLLDKRTLYVATEKEVSVNLVLEPERTPPDLTLVKAITYPSGLPAFYLFEGK